MSLGAPAAALAPLLLSLLLLASSSSSSFLLLAAAQSPPSPPFWSYAVRLSTGEVQVKKKREREIAKETVPFFSLFSFPFFERPLVFPLFCFFCLPYLSPLSKQRKTLLLFKIVWPLVPGTTASEYLVEACTDGPACQARSPAAAAGSGANPAAATAATPPCPSCAGELSLVAPSPLSPFTFYRVSLVIAGTDAAAAPPAYPLADAGNAGENLFVAPAPRGGDGAGCGSWASPCASVQPALSKLPSDPAAPVASVWIAPGYYAGASNGDLIIGGRKGIVRSLAGKEVTLLDGEWQRRIFIFSSFESPQSMVMGKKKSGVFLFWLAERRRRRRRRRKGEREKRLLLLNLFLFPLSKKKKKTSIGLSLTRGFSHVDPNDSRGGGCILIDSASPTLYDLDLSYCTNVDLTSFIGSGDGGGIGIINRANLFQNGMPLVAPTIAKVTIRHSFGWAFAGGVSFVDAGLIAQDLVIEDSMVLLVNEVKVFLEF